MQQSEKPRTLPPSRTAERFIVRLPDGMRKMLKIRAAQNERTLNAEVLYLIKRGLSADGAAQ